MAKGDRFHYVVKTMPHSLILLMCLLGSWRHQKTLGSLFGSDVIFYNSEKLFLSLTECLLSGRQGYKFSTGTDSFTHKKLGR